MVVFLELYECILLALENIAEDEDRDAAAKAATFLVAVQLGDFVVSLVNTVAVLSLTLSLSRQLQEANIDICQATQNVDTVVAALEGWLAESHKEFHSLFERSERIAELSGTSISIPRLAKRQNHRPSGPGTTVEDYYRESLYIPLVQHFVTDLKARFSTPVRQAFPLQGLVPSLLDKYSDDEILKAADLYKNELDCVSMSQLKSELTLWRGKWKFSKVSQQSAVFCYQ